LKRYLLIESRKKANLTQQAVADRLGIGRSFYGMIESGARNPTLQPAKRIADLFDSDINTLFLTEIPTKRDQH
jgi:putative transcriptional regulator